MNTEELLDYDDLGDALREGRALRPARGYRFLLAQGDLNFQSRVVSDPVPLGRQLLEAAALDPRDGYSLIAILPSGDFEDVRLNEPFDLRERGAERFIAFQTDRDFKLTLDHFFGADGLCIAEDMRMPPYEFSRDRCEHVLDDEFARVLAELRVEDDLHQQVAQLLRHAPRRRIPLRAVFLQRPADDSGHRRRRLRKRWRFARQYRDDDVACCAGSKRRR